MYNSKKISLFILFVFLSLTIWSQVDVPKILYLKDGSHLLGSLVGKSTTEYVWQLSNGNQIKFPVDFVKYVKDRKENFQFVTRGKIKKTKGFYSRIMVGEFFELNSDEYKYQNALSLNLTVGYQINSKISLGIGTGYDNYSSRKNPNGPPAIIPLYLDLAGDLFHKAVTPYYKLSAGYGFASPTKTQRSFENITYKGGLLVHPSIGIKFFTRHDLAWYIDFGYRFQQRKNPVNIWDPTLVLWTDHRASFRVGMEF